MNHVFLVVNCKTPGCTTERILKYMGPDSGERKLSESVPARFDAECGRCLQWHSYEQSEVYPLITELLLHRNCSTRSDHQTTPRLRKICLFLCGFSDDPSSGLATSSGIHSSTRVSGGIWPLSSNSTIFPQQLH